MVCFAAQERGTYLSDRAKVYSGMVIGQNGKAEDIELNVCKTKHLTNTRSSSADEALKLGLRQEFSVWSRLLSLSIQMSFWRLLQAAFVSVRRFWIRDRKRASIKKNA